MDRYCISAAQAQAIERAARENRLEFSTGLNSSAPKYSIEESQKVWDSPLNK